MSFYDYSRLGLRRDLQEIIFQYTIHSFSSLSSFLFNAPSCKNCFPTIVSCIRELLDGFQSISQANHCTFFCDSAIFYTLDFVAFVTRYLQFILTQSISHLLIMRHWTHDRTLWLFRNNDRYICIFALRSQLRLLITYITMLGPRGTLTFIIPGY